MNAHVIKTLSLVVASFIMISTCAQQPVKNYNAQWKKVDDLVKKRLPQSALTEVKKIYTLAKKEKQDAQLIKSLVYMTGLQQENRVSNLDSSIREMEKEIATSQEPVTSILNSLLAGMYWQYYQNIRWQLYNRTQTINFKKDDIATWSADDFHKKIGDLFLRSIKDEKLLQQTKLEPYDAIVNKGNVRYLRPTLYDLLAHIALQYFQNDERDIKKPAYAFEIDQASAFDPAEEFVTRKFITKDSLSLQHRALLIFQKLIAFHLKDPKPDPLVDVDLLRITFVNRQSVHPDKDQLYLNALQHITKQYSNVTGVAQAWYLIASYYAEKADSYKPHGDTTHRFDRIKAKEICERILAQKNLPDSSEGKANCYNLLEDINTLTMKFNVEIVNLPNQPFRISVDYRNFNRLYLRIIQPDEKLKKEMSTESADKYWKSVIAAKPLRSWDQSLPATNDMQEHKVEIKADELPAGEYLLVAATDKNFAGEETILGGRFFYVSSISFVNDNRNFFVLDRDNGQPLSGASVWVWENTYDYSTSRYTKKKTKQYKTDTHGFFLMDKKNVDNNYSSYFLDITYNSDHLFINDAIEYYYDYDPSSSIPDQDENEKNTYTHLFTDRSIYRPGQTVFFKGITILSGKENKRSIRDNYKTRIYLHNANSQVIDSMNVQTNEYGTFSGKFQLPQGVLNGRFVLQMKLNKGEQEIRVEEYKRPKFYVEYEPVKGTYRVNDQVKVIGKAKGYAGNNIDGATVQYRVVREPRFPYPWMFSKWWLPPSAPMEIAHGELKTDKDGKFIVGFTAIPDPKTDKKLDPVFDYTVYADVTDINGETRSGEKQVSVSYKSLVLTVTIPGTQPIDNWKSLALQTENMNGEFEPALATVTITKLKDEKRLIRARYWDRPDQFVMSKQEYIRNFPYDEYDDEDEPQTWEKGEKAFEGTDSIRKGYRFEIRNAKLSPGYYMVEVSTKDKNGEEVKDIEYVELYDEKSNQLNYPRYIWTQPPQPIEPGEKTTIQFGSSADNLFVIQQVDKPGAGSREQGAGSYEFFKLNNEKKSFDFTATEADRGGFGASYLFVKHNRFYQSNHTVFVPWTNKDLKIEYATFRDKTLPGSEEKWKVKLTGYKNEKVAAEMLASMYDASLDQFNPHAWNKPGIWPYYSNAEHWESNNSFWLVESAQRPRENVIIYKYFEKRYDYLLSNLGGAMGNLNTYAWRLKSLAKPEAETFSTYLYTTTNMAGEKVIRGGSWKDVGNYLSDSIAYNVSQPGKGQQQTETVQTRKNFNETAFFFPDLRTDSTGGIEFSFTIPEALTKWKLQLLAHTKALAFGYSDTEIVTQKQLMVQPNAPRFLREGDKMEFSAKIVNLTDKELTGQAEFQLFDAATNEPVDGRFKNAVANQYFTVAAGQSEAIKFPIEVPYQFNKALTWRIVAKADAISDGEEDVLPVLTNRALVTETMPLNMRGTGTKNFRFEKLLNSGNSETLQNHALTIEYTSNPAWYAVQSLPYLMEYPYECAEQTWNRYYANSLATMIANSSPRIKQIFEQWKTKDTSALLSNLQKNEELKSVLLEETPWVLQAKTEAEQKKNIALLFDMVKMSIQLNGSYEKLKQMQSPNGGFVWFKGGPDDRYITQYIVTGIGHLKKLKAITDGHNSKLNDILATAIPYLDRKIQEDYAELVKYKADLKKYVPGSFVVQYLYMRSFFPDYKIAAASQTAYNYFRDRAQKTWTQQSKYMQGMLALALGRKGDAVTPAAILKSLKETSVRNDELGMYWKDVNRGWWWYEAPIERQALIIEAFQEIGKDQRTVDDLRTWLLKNKQTNSWESTRATAEACYALLLQGTEWLTEGSSVTIHLGNLSINSLSEAADAGTGYFKQAIEGEKIDPEMGNITINLTSSGTANSRPSWGGVYWQYFEDLDKITTSSTPLKLVKKLFIEKNSDRGPELTPVNDGDALKVGDKIKVRIELKVDRDMEYVHMKDMRASAMEPVNVLSGYKWQGGLGYYETTKDASTNFFFSSLRKGTYVFEYPLFVTHEGNFSNGITTIQCMYAPEFTSHSEGIRINVE